MLQTLVTSMRTCSRSTALWIGPRSLICTTEDYETYPETHPQLLDKVASLLTENTILFVGYGLGDEHVRALLSRIRRTRGPWARRAYAVGRYDEVRTRLLSSRDIEVINGDADMFLSSLATEVAPAFRA
jgi:hypothetical protein